MTRVVILYNEPTLPATHPDADSEHEIVYTVNETDKVLAAAGFEVERLGAHVDPGKIVTGLRELEPDVVFNLFEGVPEMSTTEAFAAGLLEWMGLPYTGCPHQCLVMARDKPLTKRLLQSARLATPKFAVVERLPAKANRLGWPVIVKPACEDASVGVAQNSVVTNDEEYRARVEFIIEEFGPPALVEQFIPGREFNIALYEAPKLTVLPPYEYTFTRDNQWGIITYDSKWNTESKDFEATPPDYRPKIDPAIRKKLDSIAKKAYQLLGCRDLARVDVRVTPEGKPYIIEVNPNPDFSPVGGLADCLETANLTLQTVAVQMVRNALDRGATKMVEPVGVEVGSWE